MKKPNVLKIILAIEIAIIIALIIYLIGCVHVTNTYAYNRDNEGFAVVEKVRIKEYGSFLVIYDKETGVMYTVNNERNIFPLLNPDGTPRVWEGE